MAEGLSVVELAPRFIADFNVRFTRPAPHDHDAHRPIRAAEDLDLIFSWRLQRNVCRSLALQHDRIIGDRQRILSEFTFEDMQAAVRKRAA